MENSSKKSKKYNYPKQVIIQAVIESINNLNWGLLQNTNDIIVAQISQRWGSFGEKFTVSINDGEVSAYSVNDKAQNALWDWGKNNKNTISFFEEMDNCIDYINQKYISKLKNTKELEYEKTVTYDIPEQIEKLSILKEKGIISSAEFEKKKIELLNRM